jgi:hypothetical protein
MAKAKKKAKAAKKTTAKKKPAMTMAAAMSLRAKIPGIAVDLPDISNWQLAAKKLKIDPFFRGPGAKPFSCLRATQMNMDPPIKKEVEGVMIPFRSVNDFFLAPECRD